MSKIEKLGNSNSFSLFLCGILVFSPLSSMVIMDYMGLPLALPELLFIPFYFLFRRIFILRINLKLFITGLFSICLLLCISLIVGRFPISSILSTARGYFYILLVFCIFINKYIHSFYPIFLLSIGSVCGWLLNALLFLKNYVGGAFGDDTPPVVYGNMIALSLSLSIPIIFKWRKVSLFVILVSLGLSLITGLRRQIIVFTAAFIASFFLSFELKIKNFLAVIVGCFVTGFILVNSLDYIETRIFNISPILHYRVFTKTENIFLEQTNYSDEIRIESLNTGLESLAENLLPRGFVSKRTMQDEGAARFMDSPYLEFFYTFSIFGTILILFLFMKMFFFHIKSYFLYGILESGVTSVTIFTLLILIMIDGSFLNFVYTAPFTGFVLARVFSNKNLVNF